MSDIINANGRKFIFMKNEWAEDDDSCANCVANFDEDVSCFDLPDCNNPDGWFVEVEEENVPV